MRGDVLGAVERRRRWTDAEKFAVVCEVGRHGASVTQVARRHDLRRQQIYAWRHDLRKRGLCAPEGAMLFLPVDLSVPAVREAKVASDTQRPWWRSYCERSPDPVPVRDWGRRSGAADPVGRGGMIGPGTGVRVYPACGTTDMRKGIEGLAALVRGRCCGRRRRVGRCLRSAAKGVIG